MITIQIVPRIFPVVDGVGDYALNLAYQLRRDFKIETHFIVTDPNWQGNKQIDGFTISQIRKSTSTALFSFLDALGEVPSSVILHYVGCGYARRGCPTWLSKGLERYKLARPQKNLVTMFHETYGSGPPYYGADPPWVSAFWLSPIQKNIAKHIANLSNCCFTSREGFKNQIDQLVGKNKAQVLTLPVFSNVGEAQPLFSLEERNPVLVLFGSRNSRARVYEQYDNALQVACQKLEIEKIYDIGPSTGLDLNSCKNIPVLSLGKKSVSEIRNILMKARAGILNYHPEFLAKSGVYAAYSAYGIVPIVATSNVLKIDGMDGIRKGEHYWAIDQTNEKMNLELGQKIASNAYMWYQNHDLATQAQKFAEQIQAQTN